LLKEILSNCVVVSGGFAQMPEAALIGSPDIEALRWFAHSALPLGVGNGRGDSDRHRLGNLVLHFEDIGKIAVVALGPNMVTRWCLDQLRSDTDPVASLANAAFKHIADTEIAPDLFHVHGAALVGEARVAGD